MANFEECSVSPLEASYERMRRRRMLGHPQTAATASHNPPCGPITASGLERREGVRVWGLLVLTWGWLRLNHART